MNEPIGAHTRLARTSAQVSCVIDEETVVMYLETGKYFTLDKVGTSIWNLLNEEQTPQTLVDQLLQEFDTSPQSCMDDTLVFLGQLLRWNLVRVAA